VITLFQFLKDFAVFLPSYFPILQYLVLPLLGFSPVLPGRLQHQGCCALLTPNCAELTLLMLTLVVRVLPQNRHPVHNPTVDENLNGNDSDDNKELLPIEELTVCELPVKRDQ